MGCLSSKKWRSTSAPDDRATTSTRVQQLSTSSSNGIIRVPKTGLRNDRTPDSNNRKPHNENSHQLRMKPPPPAPPPSSPSSVKSLHREPTTPPTPEDERPPLHVQYAEDLKPSSQLQSETMPLTMVDKYSRPKVSVSNVTLKPNVNGINCAPMPLQDLSVEELDTEMDEFNRYRNKRLSLREGSTFNPSATDILLPRRKEKSTQETNLNSDTADNQTDKSQTDTSKRKSLRTETPIPKLTVPKETNPRDTNQPSNLEEISDYETVESNAKVILNKSESDKLNMPKLDVISDRDKDLVKFNILNDERYVETINKSVGDLSSKFGHSKSRPGTLSDIHVQTTPELQAKKQSIAVPKTIYQKDLEENRLSRKRKRNRNRKGEYTSQPRTGALNEKESEGVLAGSSKTITGPQTSETSSWIFGSKQSLGSTDSLHSFDIEVATEPKPDRYLYASSETTSINFKNYDIDDDAEIIDLEDNGDLNIGNDSWITDDQSNNEEPFDVWYGMKPYNTVQSSGRKDAGVVKSSLNGPSLSEISTKQKLMYSRFARRPQSESVLRMARKPPLPPGTELKLRPASDTAKRPHAMTKYFTTDLDIH